MLKKIMNDPSQVVDDMLKGMVFCHGDLIERLEGFEVIQRKSEKTGKVAVISGGGSGHEPSHAGFVGEGMLSAAVCGQCLPRQLLTKFWKRLNRLMKVQVSS